MTLRPQRPHSDWFTINLNHEPTSQTLRRSRVTERDIREKILLFDGASPQVFTRGDRRTFEARRVLLLHNKHTRHTVNQSHTRRLSD